MDKVEWVQISNGPTVSVKLFERQCLPQQAAPFLKQLRKNGSAVIPAWHHKGETATITAGYPIIRVEGRNVEHQSPDSTRINIDGDHVNVYRLKSGKVRAYHSGKIVFDVEPRDYTIEEIGGLLKKKMEKESNRELDRLFEKDEILGAVAEKLYERWPDNTYTVNAKTFHKDVAIAIRMTMGKLFVGLGRNCDCLRIKINRINGHGWNICRLNHPDNDPIRAVVQIVEHLQKASELIDNPTELRGG